MEIDHILICVHHKDIADKLIQAGFCEGSGNQHLGQGTANRRFFFHNCYLEFIYLDAQVPTDNSMPTKLNIRERLLSTNDCLSPFGIGLRPDRKKSNEEVTFPHWTYKPAFLPVNLSIEVGDTLPHETLYFFLNFASRPDQASSDKQQPIQHECGIQELSHIRLTIPSSLTTSDTTRYFINSKIVEIVSGEHYFMELTFDQGCQTQCINLLPDLPLVIRY